VKDGQICIFSVNTIHEGTSCQAKGKSKHTSSGSGGERTVLISCQMQIKWQHKTPLELPIAPCLNINYIKHVHRYTKTRAGWILGTRSGVGSWWYIRSFSLLRGRWRRLGCFPFSVLLFLSLSPLARAFNGVVFVAIPDRKWETLGRNWQINTKALNTSIHAVVCSPSSLSKAKINVV